MEVPLGWSLLQLLQADMNRLGTTFVPYSLCPVICIGQEAVLFQTQPTSMPEDAFSFLKHESSLSNLCPIPIEIP